MNVLLLLVALAVPCVNQPNDCVPPTAREERTLFSELTQESQRLYNALDCAGKRRALQLSLTFENKNLAVQQAAREMARRQNAVPPPEQQVEEFGGQDQFNGQYGY